MDLHFHGPDPTAAEQAAVDSVLGPPAVGLGGRAAERGRGGSFLAGWAARRPGPAATFSCPLSTPSSRGLDGSPREPSTTSAGA